MSSADLPENLDEWPDDPFETLGVARGADEREVKRAYTRRIKRFKPEQYPQHFRRLRDAYEWICRHVLPDRPPSAPNQIVLETASTLWAPGPPADATHNGPVSSTPPPAEPVLPRDRWQQWKAQWQKACAGEVGPAYSQFVAQLAGEAPPEVYIRLYWLLVAAPELDTHRSPVDWVADGIARHGFNGQLAALYIQQLRSRPQEATSQRCAKMVAAQQQPGAIIDLLTARWLAYDAIATETTDRGRWADAIFDDVELVRPRMRLFEEQALIRLLLAAIEHLSWRPTTRSADLARLLTDELSRTEFSARDLYHQLDHMEGVLVNSGAWRKAQRAPPPQKLAPLIATILNLIRRAALAPSEETRPALEDCLQQIAIAPGEALAALDFIESKGSGTAILLSNLLNVARYESEHDRLLTPNAWLCARIHDFVTRHPWDLGWTNYGRWRPVLLDFCLRHCVSPRNFRELISGILNLRRPDGVHLADLIGADVSLDCVFEASRLFWA